MFFPSHYQYKMVKDTPIKYPIEYYWLGPDLTRNILVRYIPIFPVVLITLTPDSPVRRFIPNLS